jgi:hypothetical protein
MFCQNTRNGIRTEVPNPWEADMKSRHAISIIGAAVAVLGFAAPVTAADYFSGKTLKLTDGSLPESSTRKILESNPEKLYAIA